MNKLNKSVAFFSPSFNRTGSETAIFNLINKIDNTSNILITKKKGELISRIASHIKTTSYEEYEHKVIDKNNRTISDYGRFDKALYNRLYKLLYKKNAFATPKPSIQEFCKSVDVEKYPVWYINTMVMPDVVLEAKLLEKYCILHWHETEDQLSHFSKQDLRITIDYPQLIIANSEYTRKNLQKAGRKGPIEVCYPPVQTEAIFKSSFTKISRSQLGLPEDCYLWVMSGAIDERKNPILFAEIANATIKKRPNTYFMWLGGGTLLESAYMEFVKKLCQYYDIEDKVLWFGEIHELYFDYLNLADGFLLTSTRETFSIVSVEALAMGKPYVGYFCGATDEYIIPDVGVIINTNNPLDFANVIIDIMDKKRKFDKALAKDIASRFDEQLVFNHWFDVLSRYVN